VEIGNEIKQFFLLRQKEEKITRKGDPFWDVTLADATGTVRGKVWSDSIPRCRRDVDPGQIVGVHGVVQLFQEEPQLAVKYMADIDWIRQQGGDISGLDITLLLPKSPFDIVTLWNELITGVKQEIRHEGLRELVLFLLNNHETAIKQAPGAQLYHHAYLGGLLEHTVTLFKCVLAWFDFDRKGNRDILVAGAVLHDLGKIEEIEGMGVYEKTLQGRLLGHLVQGRDLVHEAAHACTFSDPLVLVQLEHIILSHHGELEFGSPILPQTREAFIIHHLDDLTAKLKMIDDHMSKHGTKQGVFTEYHKILKRSMFVG
jgi:3'-5' exoribonuclease